LDLNLKRAGDDLTPAPLHQVEREVERSETGEVEVRDKRSDEASLAG
jgi:hypothetical protein